MNERELRAELQELQVTVGFQERTIAELNEVVLGFVARVEQLERQLEKLRETVASPPEELGPQDDRPPHY